MAISQATLSRERSAKADCARFCVVLGARVGWACLYWNSGYEWALAVVRPSGFPLSLRFGDPTCSNPHLSSKDEWRITTTALQLYMERIAGLPQQSIHSPGGGLKPTRDPRRSNRTSRCCGVLPTGGEPSRIYSNLDGSALLHGQGWCRDCSSCAVR